LSKAVFNSTFFIDQVKIKATNFAQDICCWTIIRPYINKQDLHSK